VLGATLRSAMDAASAGRKAEVTTDRADDRSAVVASFRARLRLEEILGSVAAQLLVVDPAEVEGCIEGGLGQLASELDADRAYFLRTTGRPGGTELVEWASPLVGRRDMDPDAAPEGAVRWWGRVMREQHVIRVVDVERLDGEGADIAREVLRAQGVRSLLIVPMPLRRHHAGLISLVATEPRRFGDDLVGLLRVAGEIFLSALDRADAAAALADASAELAHRNAELERSNEELERFAHAAAHDLRAPLSRIEMAVSSLSGVLEAGHPALSLVDIAARGAHGMRTLIDDLLAYATAGEGLGPATTVALDEVAETVLADLTTAIEQAGAEVTAHDLGQVTGHPSLMRQLLQNLVSNALRFRRPDATPIVRIESRPEGEGRVVSVIDNGIGIPPDQRTSVFGMFTRLHSREEHSGSGIGLATCQKIVGHLGGRIWIDDGIDGGTAVRSWLPAPADAVPTR
jgi:signal transduction histidine kinase